MISSTRRWLRRNRTNFAIGAGVLGAGYLAGQYVLGKLNEARVRMSEERIAREKYVDDATPGNPHPSSMASS
jgi:peroxin-3